MILAARHRIILTLIFELRDNAKSDPKHQRDHQTFCGLLGRVLPMTVAGDLEEPLKVVTTIKLWLLALSEVESRAIDKLMLQQAAVTTSDSGVNLSDR